MGGEGALETVASVGRTGCHLADLALRMLRLAWIVVEPCFEFVATLENQEAQHTYPGLVNLAASFQASGSD